MKSRKRDQEGFQHQQKRGTFSQRSTIFLTKNRKGLSTIVVTLIIILISLVAIGIVWVVVRNVLSSGSKDVSLGKFTVNLGIRNAYEQAGNISVDIRREVGKGELVKIKFILSDGKNSETITQDASLGELENKVFSIHPTQLAPTLVARVSVAPVFKTTEGTENVGEITSTYNLVSGGTAPGVNDTGPTCVPQCPAEWQCGTDPICGQECGSCGAGTCINHICVPPGPCTPNSQAITCAGVQCGNKVNNCGENVNCGGCAIGQMCQSGSCITVSAVNSGTVGDVWVSGMYFASPDLPKDMTGLVGDYVSFSGGSSETKCWMIARWMLPIDTPGYPNSHIGFSFTTAIKTGDHYNIWDTSDKCQANLTLS